MAKKLKLSPWHDGNVKPVHAGVYQNGCEEVFQYWNGKYWCEAEWSIDLAYRNRNKSIFQNDNWRGVLK